MKNLFYNQYLTGRQTAFSITAALFFFFSFLVIPTSAATPSDPNIEWLMVQEAGSGSLVPNDKGDYLLTLKEITPYTIYFSNRPATFAGSLTTAQFMESNPWTDDAPPNAAIVVQEAEADQDTIIVQLREPKLDTAARTLTYRVKIIPDYSGKGLAYHKGRADTAIPKNFGRVSLFIDDLRLSCPSNKSFDCCPLKKCGCICGNPLNLAYKCGTINISSCWHWLPPYGPGCGPCDIKSAFETCNSNFTSCCLSNSDGLCWVGCTRMPNPPMP